MMGALVASASYKIQTASEFSMFFVYCLVVIVAALFFFFYYNRVVALLLTWIINQYTWRHFNAYIEVDSIRFTVLGARILFKNLRYISTNESISIVKGHITVRYWLLNVRKPSHGNTKEDGSKLPCRIVCNLEGLEAFLYNNTPAYEYLKDILGIDADEPESEPVSLNFSTEGTYNLDTHGEYPLRNRHAMLELHTAADPESQSSSGSDISLFQRLLPLQFECTTGAVIVGNAELRTMIVGQASRISGVLSTVPSRSTMDHFKVVTDLTLKKLQVDLKDNMDYCQVSNVPPTPTPQSILVRWILRPLQYIFPLFKARHYGGMQHMYALMNSQKRDASTTLPKNTTYHEEYARVSTLLECSEMTITYYADSPGVVPSTHMPENPFVSSHGIDIGNGGLPPEWGVRVYVWNGVFHYGPWTDRQRYHIQNYFYPNAYRNNKPTPRLYSGQQRVATAFDFHVELMTDTTLRIPSTEKSKDWKYDSESVELDVGPDGHSIRPYGWIDIKATKDSFIKFTMPFVFGKDGIVPTLDVSLKDADITTSVNYASLLQASNFEIHIDMNTPLEWNIHRVWDIKATVNHPRIFLLRDHIFLFQDAIKDLSSVSCIDPLRFIPITYTFHLEMNDPLIYLCVNENNVISNPNSIDDNAFITFNARKVYVNATLPFTAYDPEISSIQFDVDIEQFRVGISLQTSHTLCAFLEKDNAQFCAGVHMQINGSYEYYSTVDILHHIESLNLDIKFDGITIKLFGTLIRYLVILKENYFGRWVNFSTLDEYRERRANPQKWLDTKKKQTDAKPMQDPFEVYVIAKVQDGAILLPENLYDCTHYSQIDFQELQVELRNLDIYMDMHINFSPITWSRDSHSTSMMKSGSYRMGNRKDLGNYVYIDEMNIHGHLMYGPLPEIATYLGHWSFDLGRVTGELKPSFLLGATCFSQTFIYNLIDEDNSMSVVPENSDSDALPDVIFVKATIKEVDLNLMSNNCAIKIGLKDGVNVEFDNWVNQRYSQRAKIQLSSMQITCLANQEKPSSVIFQEDTFSWVEVAKLDLGLNITVFRQIKSWRKARMEQQTFIKTQDISTRRCFHLYDVDQSSQSSHTSTSRFPENHVGVLYAPPFRQSYFDNEGAAELCDADSNLTRSASNNGSYRKYSKTSNVPSVSSYVDKWSSSDENSDEILEDSDEEIGPPVNRLSRQSGLSQDNDSFHTARSNSFYGAAQPNLNEFSADQGYDTDGYENASDETSSGVSSEDIVNQAMDSYEQNNMRNNVTESAIPPSIPYSDYLKRYSIKRATTSSHGFGFFHPYLPPPKTVFIAQMDSEDIRKNTYNLDTATKVENFFPEFDNLQSQNQEEEDDSDSKGNEMIATTVLEATSPVSILLTPILLKIVQEVTEVINKDDWDLETMLDSLQMDYIAQLTRYLTDQFIHSRFAVLMPQIYLHFIQDVMIPDDLPTYKHGQSHINTKYDQENALLCSADIALENFNMVASFKFQDFAFDEKQKSVAESKLVLQESRVHIDLGKLGFKVRYISHQNESSCPITFGIPRSRQHSQNMSPCDEYHEDEAVNELVVVDLELDKFVFKWLKNTKPNYASLIIGDFSTVIITESAEILAGAVYSWLVFIDDLEMIMERFQNSRLHQTQNFIHEIAIFSSQTGVENDPLFLTKPTNILRFGSRNFRNDVGWKLLARMRHCLRLMTLHERERLQCQLTSGHSVSLTDSRNMFNNVIATFNRWRSWEIGSNSLSRCRLLTNTFKQKTKESIELSDNTTDSIIELLVASINLAKIQVHRYEFCIYEEEKEQDDNSLYISQIDFALECIYKHSSISETVSENVFKKNNTGKDGYLDLVVKSSIGSIKIATNPVLLAFTKHMLMVQRVFTTKLRSLNHASELSVPVPETSIRHMHARSSSLPLEKKANKPLMKCILDKMDIVTHALISIDEIDVCARAQKLTMQSYIKGIHGSLLFSNPKLTMSPVFSSTDKADSDTGSGIRSSNRASRKNNGAMGNRIVFEIGGGIDLIDIRFYEMVHHSHLLVNKLLIVTLDGINVNANTSRSPRPSKRHTRIESVKEVLNVFSSIHKFNIDAPRSLLKLYGFLEDWRTEQGKKYHFMYQNLLSEWEEQRRLTYSSSECDCRVPSTKYDIKLQFLLNHFAVHSDLLPSLSIKYVMEDFFITGLSLQTPHSHESYTGGIFNIPGIRSTGSLYDESIPSGQQQSQLNSKISIDFISLSLNVGMIDSLLTAQSLLGNEVSELLEIFSYSKQKRNATTQLSIESKGQPTKEFNYCIDISLDGLRVIAESPSATGIFESNMLKATLHSSTNSSGEKLSPLWKIQGCNFALSLDHSKFSEMEIQSMSKEEKEYQRNRLAYIMIDFESHNYNLQESQRYERLTLCGKKIQDNLESYHIHLTKIQTVMQPIAIGKLAEMFIYYESELKSRREMKKKDIERLADNTKLLVQSFKSDTLENEQPTQSLFSGKQVFLRIDRLGVAVPLCTSFDALEHRKPKEASALLFSIAHIHLVTRNIENCEIKLESISLQFVKRFDQSKEEHFLAENHPRMNQMFLPGIVCNMCMTSEVSHKFINIDAKVWGFEVDIDGTITDYINALSAIYVHSKDRVDAFTAQAETGGLSSNTSADEKISENELVHVNIKGNFNYQSGIVRLYPKRHSGDVNRKKGPVKSMRAKADTSLYSRSSETNMVTIRLPGLSACFQYQTSLGPLSSVSSVPRRFHSDILVHTSENILHPSLVQFLHELMTGLKIGMQQSSEQKVKQGSPMISHGVSISLLLRLSRSKLDLSCQPSSKVVCSLGWDEGEFLMNIFSNEAASKTISCVGYISKISAIVKHQFSPEACLTASVDRITLNAMMMSQRGKEVAKDDMSMIVDIPLIVGDVNIRYLNDLLTLCALWFSPCCQGTEASTSFEKTEPTQHITGETLEHESSSSALPAPFSSHVAIRFQSILLSVDMGQAIGRTMFKPKNIVFSTYSIPFKSKGLNFELDEIQISAEGRLTGDAFISQISLGLKSNISGPSILDRVYYTSLSFIAQGFRAKFEYEYQNILEVLQEAMIMHSRITQVNGNRQLSVSMDIHPMLTRLSIKTVPTIVTMYKKFTQLLDKKMAEAGIHTKPFTEDPLTPNEGAPNTAPVQTASKPSKEKSSLSQMKINLVCHSAGIIIYPSQFQDADNVEIITQKFTVALEQTPHLNENEQGIRRTLEISLLSAELLKNVPGEEIMLHQHQLLDTLLKSVSTASNHPTPYTSTISSVKGGTNIFGIPSITLTMSSLQIQQLVEHVFSADFGGRISISLNLGLMRYLQEMGTMFTEQLDRALEPDLTVSLSTTLGRRSSKSTSDTTAVDTSSVEMSTDAHGQTSPRDSSSKDTLGDSATDPSLPTTKTSHERSQKTETLEYKSKLPVNFYPQLQVMADATPPVEWLGLKRETLPALVHENLTMNLEKIGHAMDDIFDTYTT
ncbi:hypothetical protein BDF14DRAFT_1972429 [Spinellus fusiger]|nr:hypothetical protein BDF14DRAFT_1972429 [Spinellus fusiger]